MNKKKIMIVDDHLVVREGLRQLLETVDHIEVVAEASSGFECLELIEKSSPDIILMDVKMPGINGIETTRLVCEKYPNVKVIMLTIYDDDQFVKEAIRVGAKGYILKKVERDELIKIIDHVIEDRAFLDPNVTASVFGRLREEKETFHGKTQNTSLTRRELEVLKCVVEGHIDRAISEVLYISEHTVRSHIKSIFRKMQVSSRSQMVAKALRDEIIS